MQGSSPPRSSSVQRLKSIPDFRTACAPRIPTRLTRICWRSSKAQPVRQRLCCSQRSKLRSAASHWSGTSESSNQLKRTLYDHNIGCSYFSSELSCIDNRDYERRLNGSAAAICPK